MEDFEVNISKILSGFNMEGDAEISSKLANFNFNNSDDNVMEILQSINGIGYEIDENLYSLPSMSMNKLYERKKQIIISHHELAHRYYDSLTFSKRLQRKLALLNHLYDILHIKYYSTKDDKNVQILMAPQNSVEESIKPVIKLTGQQVLIQLTIKTGLTMFFTLLKQSWENKNANDINMGLDVLSSALTLMRELNPLSLGSKAELPQLGLDCLDNVMLFVKECLNADFIKNINVKEQLAELSLLLAYQRESLIYLLEWIDMALNIDDVCLPFEKLYRVLEEMSSILTFAFGSEEFDSYKSKNTIPLQEVALLLMKKLVSFGETSVVRTPLNQNSAELPQPLSEVFMWGSNSSNQHAEGATEVTDVPRLVRSLSDVQQVEAGQYCTFIIDTKGCVSACGKNSYGRLGLGNSSNQPVPKRININCKIKQVSSSKGCDGHSLALSDTGHVYSWGDGDYGKLGHGDVATHKEPKLIQGPFVGKVIELVSAGYRHSAAVTSDGQLYTWGEGDHGRLGHGDCNPRLIPTLVKSLSDMPVGYVACGSTHTLACSRDGNTVWSFGSGDNGKLGHGNTLRLYKPQKIDGLRHYKIKKVAAGIHFSVALACTGEVFTWGQGSNLGCGSSEITLFSPAVVEDLMQQMTIDISVGDSHCLALTRNCAVYAWGSNGKGQCGQGHSTSPVSRPSKVINLEGKQINQISAGTSHSVAWTTLPPDRQTNVWHSPFCIDLHESTFKWLRQFIEKYCEQIESHQSTPNDLNEEMLILSLNMLNNHLFFARVSGHDFSKLLGNETSQLRTLLLKLVDLQVKEVVERSLMDCLSTGASLLLPPLSGRLSILKSLLAQETNLTTGQKLLLDVTVSSLNDNSHISSLFRVNSMDLYENRYLSIEEVMKLLLKHLTNSTITLLESNNYPAFKKGNKLNETLTSLHKLLLSHLLAYNIKSPHYSNSCLSMNRLFVNHLESYLVFANTIFRTTVASYNDEHYIFYNDVLSSSIVGETMINTLNSLTFLQSEHIQPVLTSLINTVQSLHILNQKMCINDPDKMNESIWFIELESAFCLLIGRLISYGIISSPLCPSEICNERWLKSKLFSSGIEKLEDKSIFDDIEERLKKISNTGFIVLEHELNFIPQPYLNLLKYILCDYEQNEDNVALTICNNFKDKYESFLKDNKYDMITRLTLPLFYVTLIKIDGRPLKDFLFNKNLVSFINEMCMKMFFALVNNLEKSIMFSESNFPNSAVDEYQCLNISSKCCFLLTAVRGMHSDLSLPNKHLLKDDLTPANKSVLESVLEFVLDSKQATNPYALIQASEVEEIRAHDRLAAFNRITKMLKIIDFVQDSSNHISLNHMCKVFEAFICGLLGLYQSQIIEHHTIDHYYSAINTVPRSIKRQIQSAVLNIYKHFEIYLRMNIATSELFSIQISILSLLNMHFTLSDFEYLLSNNLPEMLVNTCKLHVPFMSTDRYSLVIVKMTSNILYILGVSGCNPYSSFESIRAVFMNIHNLLDILMNSTQCSIMEQTFSETSNNILPEGVNSQDSYPVQSYICDLLSFVLQCTSFSPLCISSIQWTETLLRLAQCSKTILLAEHFRCKLLILRLLRQILPHLKLSSSGRKKIVKTLLEQLAANMWLIPQQVENMTAYLKQEDLDKQMDKIYLNDPNDSNRTNIDIGELPFSFHEEKSSNCIIEKDHTVIHTHGGRAYALGYTPFESGVYQWKFFILKEHQGNEGSCIGISKYPIKDLNYRTTADMWLYRAYNGVLYNGGQKPLALKTFTQGDYITAIFDTGSRTLSFAKNNDYPIVAFHNIDTKTKLYPCVLCYSTAAGQKIKISDYRAERNKNTELFAGEPYLAPMFACINENYIKIIRILHNSDLWLNEVNECLLEQLSFLKSVLPEVCFKTIILEEISKSVQKEPICENIGEIDVNILCEKVWPTLAVIGGLDRGLRVDGRCYDVDQKSFGTIMGTLKKGFTSTKVMREDKNDTVSDVLFKSLLPCNNIKFNPTRLEYIPALLLYSIGRLSGITNELVFPNNTQTKTSDNFHEDKATKSMDMFYNQMVMNIMDKIKNDPSSSKTQDLGTNIPTKGTSSFDLANEAKLFKLCALQASALKSLEVIMTSSMSVDIIVNSVPPKSKQPTDANKNAINDTKKKRDNIKENENMNEVLIFLFRCAFEKSLCSKNLVIETDIIDCERILNILYNNYLKECAEKKYRIPDLQNRLKTLISFQESTNVKRRESISGETSRTTDDTPRRIVRSRRNMLHRSNTIYVCPNYSEQHTNSLLLRNENNERIPSIATPLIEMGFSARLVQRAILALGNTWETMPRNVAINSLATWMIEHPCIQETNFESSDNSTESRSQIPVIRNPYYGGVSRPEHLLDDSPLDLDPLRLRVSSRRLREQLTSGQTFYRAPNLLTNNELAEDSVNRVMQTINSDEEHPESPMETPPRIHSPTSESNVLDPFATRIDGVFLPPINRNSGFSVTELRPSTDIIDSESESIPALRSADDASCVKCQEKIEKLSNVEIINPRKSLTSDSTLVSKLMDYYNYINRPFDMKSINEHLDSCKFISDCVEDNSMDKLGMEIVPSLPNTEGNSSNILQHSPMFKSLPLEATLMSTTEERIKAINRMFYTISYLASKNIVINILMSLMNWTFESEDLVVWKLEKLGIIDVSKIVNFTRLILIMDVWTDREYKESEVLPNIIEKNVLELLSLTIVSLAEHYRPAYKLAIAIPSRDIYTMAVEGHIYMRHNLKVIKLIVNEFIKRLDVLSKNSVCGIINPNEYDNEPSVKMLINALSACLLSHVVGNEIKHWACKQLVNILVNKSLHKKQIILPNESDFPGVLKRCPIVKLEGHENRINHVVWQPKVKSLATSGFDGTMRLWNNELGLETLLMFFKSPQVYGNDLNGELISKLSWSPSGLCIAASMEGTLNIYTIQRQDETYLYTHTQDAWITTLAWSGASIKNSHDFLPQYLLVGGVDGSVNMAHIDSLVKITYEKLSDFCCLGVPVSHIAWHDDLAPFAIAFSSGAITIGKIQTITEPESLTICQSPISTLQWSKAFNILSVSNVEDKMVRLWVKKQNHWEIFHELDHFSEPSCVVWSPIVGNKGLVLCVGTVIGSISVWLIPTPFSKFKPKVLYSFQGHLFNSVTSMSIHSSGLVLATSCSRGTSGVVNIWSLFDGSLLNTHTGPGGVDDLCWMEDKLGLAVCFSRSKDVTVIQFSADNLMHNRFQSNARSALHRCGLHKVQYFCQFIYLLPELLQLQVNHEKHKVLMGDHLLYSDYLKGLIGIALEIWPDQTFCFPFVPPNSSHSIEFYEEWQWLQRLITVLNTAKALLTRKNFPDSFLSYFSSGLSEENADHYLWKEAINNNNWTIEADQQIVQWFNTTPHDWQPYTKCDAYLWGNGRNGQLGDTAVSCIWSPVKIPNFKIAQRIVCGQNCTFVLTSQGTVLSCGEGNYGRLGHGHSDSLHNLTMISALQGFVITQVATSIGSDGHSLALTETGEVFSWGDGDFGKLGHGNNERQRKPKLIESLYDVVVIQVACGHKHSAVLSQDGEVYVFGSAEHGKLGLGGHTNKKRPTKIIHKGFLNVKHIACGQNHTVCVGENVVWAFGEGGGGKLGIGSKQDSYIPQPIITLTGKNIKKAYCGNGFTMFLSEDGELYSCGLDNLQDSSDVLSSERLYPEKINEFLDQTVIDVATGPDHVLVLTSRGDVWAWGNNSEGILGFGHNVPVPKPKIIPNLSDKNIKQIATSRTHCAAWTAEPFSRDSTNISHNDLPTTIPYQYGYLQQYKIASIAVRMKCLQQFSNILYTCWQMIPFNMFKFDWSNIKRWHWLADKRLKYLYTNKVIKLPLMKVISRTMNQGQNYGPQIIVKRLSSNGTNLCIFEQVAKQIVKINAELLRLPSRAWKVKLVGEGADDAGGVFDDTIAQMMEELQSQTVKLLVLTPNGRNETGYNQDRYLFNSKMKRNKQLLLFQFLGILFGVAIRTKKPLALPLSPLIWKMIIGESLNLSDLEENDIYYAQNLISIQNIHQTGVTEDNFEEAIPFLYMTGTDWMDNTVPLVPNGHYVSVTYSNRLKFCELALKQRFHEMDDQILAVRRGLAAIVPLPLLTFQTAENLERMICGLPNISIPVLKTIVRYREMDENSQVVQWLWDILNDFSDSEKVLFLRFVCGRSRLPSNLSDFSQHFQIIKVEDKIDGLPTAQTCFFQLRLTDYSSRAVFEEKLKYAINNCRTIDMDNYMLFRNTDVDSDDDLDMMIES
ncbi:probable E3 ubiquitin-protein ligase HERC1 isoform X2 [Sipha flava]|uniref:Probable E3 ubiquitin-protein ligase HERC1 isoform X2 n=1 Tax=Sipha flava TaxID=143950 RepID=A0A8B8FCE4_9HEMI|nr:probable E3 ubiquitin-protein ligase HERC1 isoform X2 [Sipha flava]